MLGYVHLTAGRPVLERRAAAGMTYWALEGDLDGGLFPGRRLRRWIGRLERCGVSHAALPPGREGDFAPLRPVLPDGLRLALLPQLLDFTAARFPDYRHNPYLKGYPARKKLVLSLLGKKQYRAVHMLFAAAGH